MQEEKVESMKFVLFGPAGSGKSSLLSKKVGHYKPTVGVEFRSQNQTVDGGSFKFQGWDTAGQYRYRSIAKSYCRDAAGLIFVYDASKRESLVECQ